MNKVKLKLRLYYSFIIILAQVVSPIESFGQLESGYSFYRFNPQVISPAYSGSSATSEVTLMNRQRWLGLEGAPMTYVFSGNFKLKSKFGLGLNAMYDAIGPLSISTLGTDAAYQHPFKNNWTLSGGIRAGLTNLALKFDELRLVNQGDPNFVNRSTMEFNTGWGLKIAKGDGFFVSISQPRSLKIKYYWSSSTKGEFSSALSLSFINDVSVVNINRATGGCVRCIKN